VHAARSDADAEDEIAIEPLARLNLGLLTAAKGIDAFQADNFDLAIKMLQEVGYTEAMAMALLTLFLLALSKERWLWAMSLALLLGLTRPIAVPIAAVTVVALWCRWRVRSERPLVTTEIVSGVAALAGCVVSGLLWPAIAGAVTGQANAYTVTMSTWRASREIVPFKPWLDMSRYYFGQTWGPVWLTVLFVVIAVMVLGPWATRLGPQLRMWSLAYPAYLLVVLDPFTSIFRYLIPLFPLAAVLIEIIRIQPTFKISFASRPFHIKHRKPGRVAITAFHDHVLAKDPLEREAEPSRCPH